MTIQQLPKRPETWEAHLVIFIMCTLIKGVIQMDNLMQLMNALKAKVP